MKSEAFVLVLLHLAWYDDGKHLLTGSEIHEYRRETSDEHERTSAAYKSCHFGCNALQHSGLLHNSCEHHRKQNKGNGPHHIIESAAAQKRVEGFISGLSMEPMVHCVNYVCKGSVLHCKGYEGSHKRTCDKAYHGGDLQNCHDDDNNRDQRKELESCSD